MGDTSIKVKKTDLPVLPPSVDQDVLTSGLDDDLADDGAASAADAVNDNDDDDDEDLDDDEDMMADEAADTDDNDDYDSDEDADDQAPDDDAWEKLHLTVRSGALADSDPASSPAAATPTVGAVTTTSTTTTKATEPPTDRASAAAAAAAAAIDPYFTHFDPRAEHQSYKVKDAQQRLEEEHREKVTHVMKNWSDLEEKYQDMRQADPKAAQAFKQRMTARFQALEEEGNAEKHQMAAMHQQRVLAHINQRKREAMNCYTQSLTEQPPNAHRVEKCLQKLLRALHKDRAHALAHYRHLLSSGGAGGLEAASSERPRTLERLVDIDRAVNQSMSMLKRYPELTAKLSQLMDDYIQALRSKDDTPGAMLGMTEDAEASILDKYRDEIERKVTEKERQRIAEKQRKEQRSQERERLRDDKMRLEAKKLDLMVKEQEKEKKEQQQQQQKEEQQQQDQTEKYMEQTLMETTKELPLDETSSVRPSPTALPTVDDAAVQRAVEDVAAAVAHQEIEPRSQHVMTHDLGHGEAAYSVRHEVYGASGHDGRNIYFTMVFAGMALMGAIFVGVAVTKWRSSRHPHAQGFVEVDQTVGVQAPVTPEEKHVANMQINGYENPTYKYFEVKE